MDSGLILSLDSSTSKLSLNMTDLNFNILFSKSLYLNKNTNSLIFKYLEECILISNYNITKLLIGIGPGSYSGIRVGIAALQGLKLALNIPIFALPSFYAVENKIPFDNEFYMIEDARRNKIHLTRVKRVKDNIIDKKNTEDELKQIPLFQKIFKSCQSTLCYTNTYQNGLIIDRNELPIIFELIQEENIYTLDSNMTSDRLKLVNINSIYLIKYFLKSKNSMIYKHIEPIYIFPPVNF